MGYSTTNLLSRVRIKAGLSSNDADYTDTVLLDIADQYLLDEISPKILKLYEDYYLTYVDYTITADRQSHPIPTRASFGTVHSFFYLNTDKTEHSELYYIDNRDTVLSTTGAPTRHMIRDNNLVLYAPPNTTDGYIRVFYFYTPSNLVATTACMLITGGLDTGVLTGDAPSGWDETLKYDIVSGESPFELITPNLTASAVSVATSITFTLADLDTARMAETDCYVALAKQSCFPMIPNSLHYLLADVVAMSTVFEMGDSDWNKFYVRWEERVKAAIETMTPRKITERKPFINRTSCLRFRANA